MKMKREQAIEEIRLHVDCRQFLQKSKSGLYCCPYCGSGSGKNGTGAMKYYPETNTCACFAGCAVDSGQKGKSYDAFDLMQKHYGCDFNTAVKMGADMLHITIDSNADAGKEPAAGNQTENDGATPTRSTTEPQTTAEADYTAYYEYCRKQLYCREASFYLSARGISLETAAACGIGFDPAADPANAPGAMGDEYRPHPCPRIIIPTSKGHYVGRSIDPETPKAFEKLNPNKEKGAGAPAIFNKNALYAQDVQEIFVTEGAFDALSVIEAGGAALALNSTNNVPLLLQILEKQPTAATFVICMDSDKAGENGAAALMEGFNRLQIPFITADINCGRKDANEALIADRAAFTAVVQAAQQQAQDQRKKNGIPGLLTFTDAVKLFETADNEIIEFKAFPTFGKTAKIKKHDSIVIAADTGGGKSSLAINFMNDLSETYPCIYINLEMDTLDVLQRLVAIHSGIEIDRIQGYQNDPETAKAVNVALRTITARKPLQIVQGAYLLEEVQAIVEQSTKGREEVTAVFIDHSLLMDTQQSSAGRYDRFTQLSEGLRKMALRYNIVLFVLLQQNRAGKAAEEERPKNSSLKESGSWENDSTQICFLWYDPIAKRKKLLLTKNRHGESGEFTLDYWSKTQTYTEAKDQTPAAVKAAPQRTSKREKAREKLANAYLAAFVESGGKPTLRGLAEAADVTTSTIKSWIREYGGCTVDGVQIDPAGIDTEVEYSGFIKLTPADEPPFTDAPGNTDQTAGANISARF